LEPLVGKTVFDTADFVVAEQTLDIGNASNRRVVVIPQPERSSQQLIIGTEHHRKKGEPLANLVVSLGFAENRRERRDRKNWRTEGSLRLGTQQSTVASSFLAWPLVDAKILLELLLRWAIAGKAFLENAPEDFRRMWPSSPLREVPVGISDEVNFVLTFPLVERFEIELLVLRFADANKERAI